MNKNNLRQTHRYLVKSCFNSCPLETLVLLNSYWDIIYGIDGISSKDSNNENDDHKINNFMEKLSSTGFKKRVTLANDSSCASKTTHPSKTYAQGLNSKHTRDLINEAMW